LNRKTNFNKYIREIPASVSQVVAAAKSGDQDAGDKLCAHLGWVAFSCPQAITQVYDEVMSNWLGSDINPHKIGDTEKNLSTLPQAPISDSFLQAFWSLVDDADKGEGYDATSITVRSAQLAGLTDHSFEQLAEDAAAIHQGCSEPATRQTPQLYSISMLAGNPEGSLVNDLYKMWVDNNFDPEVLDREGVGLSHLKPNNRYLNTRILQMHDVWHLVAGYQTTALHEIAISSFQLAQFGHNYSATFLAGILMITQTHRPEGFPFIIQTLAEAWTHGRETTPMMDIEWQDIWHHSIETIRTQHGIKPFKSDIPANFFELQAA